MIFLTKSSFSNTLACVALCIGWTKNENIQKNSYHPCLRDFIDIFSILYFEFLHWVILLINITEIRTLILISAVIITKFRSLCSSVFIGGGGACRSVQHSENVLNPVFNLFSFFFSFFWSGLGIISFNSYLIMIGYWWPVSNKWSDEFEIFCRLLNRQHVMKVGAMWQKLQKFRQVSGCKKWKSFLVIFFFLYYIFLLAWSIYN